MNKKAIPENTTDQIKQGIIFGVGYGQPPRRSQFKKSQSGNPKGRPRVARQTSVPDEVAEHSNAAIMTRVLNEPVIITKNGKRRKISKAEFVQRASEKQIADGSYYAMRDAKAELREVDARKERDIAEDHAYWSDYLVRREADIAATSAKGLPPSRFWIDPEDIFFREGERVHIRGPLLQKEVRGFELLAQQFKIRMVEWVGRLIFGREPDDLNDMDISATLACITWGLPHRLRKSCMAAWDELTDPFCLLGRHYDDLRQRIWAEVGQTPPRKFLAPIDLSPQARKVLKDLKGSVASTFHRSLLDIADRKQSARRKVRSHIRRKGTPIPARSPRSG